MTSCLLCPSPAVADLLCVPCGADLFWCRILVSLECLGTTQVIYFDNIKRPALTNAHRASAGIYDTPNAGRMFFARLETARKAREGAPLCSHVAHCPRPDDDPEGVAEAARLGRL